MASRQGRLSYGRGLPRTPKVLLACCLDALCCVMGCAAKGRRRSSSVRWPEADPQPAAGVARLDWPGVDDMGYVQQERAATDVVTLLPDATRALAY